MSTLSAALDLYQSVLTWRKVQLGDSHVDTVRSIECLAICHARLNQHAEAETGYFDALSHEANSTDPRLLENLCLSLQAQTNWVALEAWSRQLCNLLSSDDDLDGHRARSAVSSERLFVALEQQGKSDEAAEVRRTSSSRVGSSSKDPSGGLEGGGREGGQLPTLPRVRVDRRFGRMIHPRTWSA
ncbi:MAG: hypothetical protein Q9220_003835 [cf. Caloplaca sp. 1 TL-2023]